MKIKFQTDNVSPKEKLQDSFGILLILYVVLFFLLLFAGTGGFFFGLLYSAVGNIYGVFGFIALAVIGFVLGLIKGGSPIKLAIILPVAMLLCLALLWILSAISGAATAILSWPFSLFGFLCIATLVLLVRFSFSIIAISK